MQIQNVEQIGCVYKRVRGKHKSIPFERAPALKIPAADGTVLLRPLPATPPAPKIPRNTNGSVQCSALIIGMRKHACVGNRF